MRDDLSEEGGDSHGGHSLSKERAWTYPVGLGEPLKWVINRIGDIPKGKAL